MPYKTAIGVEQNCRGDASDTESAALHIRLKIGFAALAPKMSKTRPTKPVRMFGGHLRRSVDADGYQCHTSLPIVVPGVSQLIELSHRLLAGAAPCGPKLKQHDLSAKTRERNAVATSNVDELQVRA